MTNLQSCLIELYARGPVDAVHALPDYVALCAAHEHDAAFHGERLRVQRLRAALDEWLGQRQSYSSQVEFALRLLWGPLKRAVERELCRELTLQSYGQKWAIAQREYFERTADELIAATHYFLSFTNRNPGRPALNLINRRHRHFIIEVLGQRLYEEADLSEDNLVAKAVHHLLRNRSLEGFYYPAHEENNEVVKEKLRAECLRALAFVQLVQQEMFRLYRESPNWCWWEYRTASEADPERLVFVRLEESIASEEIALDMQVWFDAVEATDAVKLSPTPHHEPGTIDANFDKIEKNLSNQVRQRLNRLFLSVPA
jgi:hypothetical protein